MNISTHKIVLSMFFISLVGCSNSGLKKRVEVIENNFDSFHADHEEFRKVVNNHAVVLENITAWINKIVARGDRVEEIEELVTAMNQKLTHIKFIRMPNGKYFIGVEGQPTL